MTINTDSVRVKNGTDYSFVCGKIPFAITCSSTLQHGSYNVIDLDIVNKMKIPLQKIKVCRMTYKGENLRSVGYIDQTIQCVQNGVIQGTVHLSAKVVRNLFENFNVDCIASFKTYERLTIRWRPMVQLFYRGVRCSLIAYWDFRKIQIDGIEKKGESSVKQSCE